MKRTKTKDESIMRIAFSMVVVLGLAAGTVLAAAPQGGTTTAPAVDSKKAENDVRACIDEGIKDLEAKDYASAFKVIAGPIAEQAEKEGKLEHSVEVLKAGMGDELLKGLKAAKESTATVEEDGQTVSFDISDKFPDAPKMTFKRWGTKWYLD